jgi:NADH:ubiquinone oxidoreductase subunit 2 (subunit N)
VSSQDQGKRKGAIIAYIAITIGMLSVAEWALYYYLTVLKYVYLYRSDDENTPLEISRPYSIALTILIIGIILVGTLFGPWFNISSTIASSLY